MGKEFNFESFKTEVLKLMYARMPLTNKYGAVHWLRLLNAAVEGEMDAHVNEEK